MKQKPERLLPPGGSNPDAARPLSAFRRIVVRCNDCGDTMVLEDAQLAELSAVPSFGDLWRLSFCRSCRASGAQGPANLTLHGESGRSSPQPDWSADPVFGENRSDPFPTLPRRPMFDR